MRVRPSVKIGVLLAISYTVLFGAMFKLSGVDYDDIVSTSDNALKAVVIPLAILATILVVTTTAFGWWKPVLRDGKRAGGQLIAVPIVMVVLVIVGVNYVRLGELDTSLLVWIAIGTALVGFSEELVYRGLIVVSFRSTLK